MDDYPSLFLYKAGDKDSPVIVLHNSLTSICLRYFLASSDIVIHFALQIKLSTKSGSKELAAFINKHTRTKDEVAKDEL